MALSPCAVRTDEEGRELAEHGQALFPVACYEDDLTVETVPWHWHEEWEAVVVESGQALVHAGNESCLLSPGEGFFLNAGVLHAVESVGPAGCLLHSVVFHPRLVGGSIDSVFWQSYVAPLLADTRCTLCLLNENTPWRAQAAGQVEQAWQSIVEEASGYEFAVRAALSRLVALLFGHYSSAAKLPDAKALRDDQRMKTMLNFLYQNYARPLQVAQIAASASLSESECLRCFRGSIGVSPIRQLRLIRIQKAAGLLVQTEEKVEDIGAACGFLDPSYFIKSFRRVKGCTPAAYRQTRKPAAR